MTEGKLELCESASHLSRFERAMHDEAIRGDGADPMKPHKHFQITEQALLRIPLVIVYILISTPADARCHPIKHHHVRQHILQTRPDYSNWQYRAIPPGGSLWVWW